MQQWFSDVTDDCVTLNIEVGHATAPLFATTPSLMALVLTPHCCPLLLSSSVGDPRALRVQRARRLWQVPTIGRG